jgi:hypothetical protein
MIATLRSMRRHELLDIHVALEMGRDAGHPVRGGYPGFAS